MRIDFDNANTVGCRTRREPGAHLLDAIRELAGGRAELVSHHQSAWASITFSGMRLSLRFDGAEAVAAGDAFVAALPEHEFAVPGQIVAAPASSRSTTGCSPNRASRSTPNCCCSTMRDRPPCEHHEARLPRRAMSGLAH